MLEVNLILWAEYQTEAEVSNLAFSVLAFLVHKLWEDPHPRWLCTAAAIVSPAMLATQKSILTYCPLLHTFPHPPTLALQCYPERFFACNSKMADASALGVGGQPYTTADIGMWFPRSQTTKSDSANRPPLIAQLPMAMTYFGSNI